MSNYRFVCSHCGKSFQLETPQAKECPFCFWASSVKREDEALAEKKKASPAALKAEQGAGSGQLLPGILFLLKAAFFLVLLAGVVYLGYQLYSRWAVARKNSSSLSISEKDVERADAAARANNAALIALLSQEEKSVLYGEVKLPEKIGPGAAEKAVLERTADFKTGWSEKLPSPVWTLPQYQQMIAEQQQFYKIPFARSYKKKLEELFTSKYLAGSDAFTKGDLLSARNLWVESLALPLYSTDVQKQRAVALTMLKPFINDTLAKIGALNQALITKEKRAKEASVTAAYQELRGLINQEKWAEAVASIDQLEPVIGQLEVASQQQAAPPSYPPAIAMVDQDIQRALADLLAPAPVSVADLLGLKQDLAEKRDVLAGLTEDQVKASRAAYANALSLIRGQKWQDALSVLNSVQNPEVLKKDAQAKAAVLQKILSQGLARPETAG